MNHRAIQFLLVRSRCHGDCTPAAADCGGIEAWTTLIQIQLRSGTPEYVSRRLVSFPTSESLVARDVPRLPTIRLSGKCAWRNVPRKPSPSSHLHDRYSSSRTYRLPRSPRSRP